MPSVRMLKFTGWPGRSKRAGPAADEAWSHACGGGGGGGGHLFGGGGRRAGHPRATAAGFSLCFGRLESPLKTGLEPKFKLLNRYWVSVFELGVNEDVRFKLSGL